MHPQRWGDPARAVRPARGRPCPGRGGLRPGSGGRPDRRPDRRPEPARCPPTGLPAAVLAALRDVVGDEHVRTDDETAPPAHARQVDPGPAPGPGRRPRRRPRRRGPAGRATTRSCEVLAAGVAAPRRGRAVRRRHLRHRRSGGPPRGVRRACSAWTSVRLDRLVAVDTGLDDGRPRARAARPAGRGAAGRARPDHRPLPAVVRARLDRRVRGDAVQRSGVGGVRPLRRPGRRPHRGHADRAPCVSAPPRPTPPARTCASWCSAPRAPSA